MSAQWSKSFGMFQEKKEALQKIPYIQIHFIHDMNVLKFNVWTKKCETNSFSVCGWRVEWVSEWVSERASENREEKTPNEHQI